MTIKCRQPIVANSTNYDRQNIDSNRLSIDYKRDSQKRSPIVLDFIRDLLAVRRNANECQRLRIDSTDDEVLIITDQVFIYCSEKLENGNDQSMDVRALLVDLQNILATGQDNADENENSFDFKVFCARFMLKYQFCRMKHLDQSDGRIMLIVIYCRRRTICYKICRRRNGACKRNRRFD